ncbi:hypothetical protein NDU88_006139 [Pleurodeles waltl]|uniref:Uncharacterized protein n=1 Tax=Pleurodeles waltl TaxID=8319 RepID=A0AAV7NQY2_PLEWA|nr:hypothetical protein NDU88_006139 [Pleurodeles waltl]
METNLATSLAAVASGVHLRTAGGIRRAAGSAVRAVAGTSFVRVLPRLHAGGPPMARHSARLASQKDALGGHCTLGRTVKVRVVAPSIFFLHSARSMKTD